MTLLLKTLLVGIIALIVAVIMANLGNLILIPLVRQSINEGNHSMTLYWAIKFADIGIKSLAIFIVTFFSMRFFKRSHLIAALGIPIPTMFFTLSLVVYITTASEGKMKLASFWEIGAILAGSLIASFLAAVVYLAFKNLNKIKPG